MDFQLGLCFITTLVLKFIPVKVSLSHDWEIFIYRLSEILFCHATLTRLKKFMKPYYQWKFSVWKKWVFFHKSNICHCIHLWFSISILSITLIYSWSSSMFWYSCKKESKLATHIISNIFVWIHKNEECIGYNEHDRKEVIFIAFKLDKENETGSIFSVQ